MLRTDAGVLAIRGDAALLWRQEGYGPALPRPRGIVAVLTPPTSLVTGPGSAEAAKMAVEDFGKQVLGKPIAILVADQQNKADVAAARAREWLDNEKVDALLEVVGSSPALAAMDIAKTKNKIIVLNGPGQFASPTKHVPRSLFTGRSTRSP